MTDSIGSEKVKSLHSAIDVEGDEADFFKDLPKVKVTKQLENL